MENFLRAAVACAALTCASASFGAAGDLDTTFNGNGVVTTNNNYLAISQDSGEDVALDADGNVVVVGAAGTATNGKFIVIRYTSAGVPDATFDSDGIAEALFTDNPGNGHVAYSLGIDSVGRIIAAGSVNGRLSNSEIGLARFLADGSLDPGFDTDGKFEFDVAGLDVAYGLAVDASDRLVTVGRADNDFLIARTTTAGALDATFGGTGTVIGPVGIARGVAIDSSGRIVVAGFTNSTNTADLVIARYLDDGSVDPGFNSGNPVVFDLGGKEQGYAVTIDASDRIVVVGSTGANSAAQFLVARFDSSGALDTTFNTVGYIQVTISSGADIAYDVAQDAAGNTIAVGGAFTNTGIIRLTPAGTLDPQFGAGGILNADLAATGATAGQQDRGNGVAIDSSNRLLVTGQMYIDTTNRFDFSTARIDNSSVGSIQFSAPTYSIGESGGSATITATRVGGSEGAVSVDYATADDSAMAGSDYTATSGTLNWADGDVANKTFTVPVSDDLLNEIDEDVNLTLTNPTGGAVLGAQNLSVLTIVDDDPVPTLSIDDVSMVEGDVGTQSFTFSVSLSAASGLPVTVNFATNDGTATGGSDYTTATGMLSFAPGETLMTIDVVVQGDTLVEPDEGFTVELSMPTNATLLDGSGSGMIINDDAAGSIQFSAPTYSVAEDSVSATITATRTAGSDGAVSVDYASADGSATAGSDYTATSGTLNWADGDTTDQTFQVLITNDTTVEPDETVNLSLSNVTGGAILGAQTTAVLTIVDNDVAGSIQFSAPTYSVAEEGVSATITATRTTGSDGAVSADYASADGSATAGSDYTATSGTLNWADGDTTDKSFQVPVTDDATDEADETVNLSLSNVTGGAILGAQTTAVLTIVDNDVAGVAQVAAASYSVQENDGSVTITVTRSGGASGAVSVDFATMDGSAVAGMDYAANIGTLTWADGDVTDKTITVVIVDDVEIESAESFSVVLSNPGGGLLLGAGSTTTVTIEGNDPVFVALPVPAVSRWALLLMALLLVGVTGFTLSRRQ